MECVQGPQSTLLPKDERKALSVVRERAKNRPSSRGGKNQLKIIEFFSDEPMVQGGGPGHKYTNALQTRKKFVEFGAQNDFFHFRFFVLRHQALFP